MWKERGACETGFRQVLLHNMSLLVWYCAGRGGRVCVRKLVYNNLERLSLGCPFILGTNSDCVPSDTQANPILCQLLIQTCENY